MEAAAYGGASVSLTPVLTRALVVHHGGMRA